jgi:DNA-binding winged helix-turn-helix (wHTH) protein/tetratricopeptide (TPR) repeat protein
MARLLYRFGDCSVDPAARELRRGGRPVTLSPKVFDCLAYLIDHRDRAVGRDELIAAVWGRADVSDALLGQAVLKARRAVADTGDEQNAIRTVPRFGYRWVAAVEVEELPDLPRGAGRSARSEADEPATRTRWRAAWPLAAVLVAAVAASIWIVAMRRHDATPSASSATPDTAAPLTAVLPVVVDAGPEWSWLRLGLMDLFAEQLRHAGLAVVPSDNVVAAIGAAGNDADAIAAAVRTATGARQLIVPKATLTATGWRIHLDVQIDGRDRELAAQHDDAVVAARAAAMQLLDRLGKSPAGASADSADAPTILQQRVEAAMLSDDIAGARRILDAAPPVLRDRPEMELRRVLLEIRAGRMDAARTAVDALLASAKAETDPALRARALTAAGTIAVHTGDNAQALRRCEEAIALLADRNEPAAAGRAYTGCGVAHARSGNFDAAMTDFAHARVALQIAGDALSLARIEANEGFMEITRGRYAEGAAIMRRSEERFQRFGGRIEVLAAIGDQVLAALALAEPAEALAISERGWTLRGQLENVDMRRAFDVQRARALAANGRMTEAVTLLAAIVAEATPGQNDALLGAARATEAEIELAQGRLEPAIEHARAAVNALKNPDDARDRAVAWLTLVRGLRATRDAGAAAEAARFSAWSDATPIPAARVYAALALAEQASMSDRAAANARYEQALKSAESGGAPAEILEVVLSWGGALIDAGDLERAGAVVGRVARWSVGDFASSVLEARLYLALGRDDAWREALARAQKLAGERPVPAFALRAPAP